MDMLIRSGDLLKEWCEALLRLQITGTGSSRLDGAILCPSCGKIHGRCFEAMYPFLSQVERDPDHDWIAASMALFDWVEATLSLPSGAFLNDIDSDWVGTTVFSTIQLVDCITFYGHLIPLEYKQRILERIRKAADFLYDFDSLLQNNINYPITNALALHLCGQLLEESRYIEKAKKFASVAKTVVTENGLIFGEGVPRTRKSRKGCVSVDIGYNVEETLPSLALYGFVSGDEEASLLAKQSLQAHLAFFLEDGGWDNSFGTRNFKWSYWGSRTSDGCLVGYLLYAKQFPEFASAAVRNFTLLQACTNSGLLSGGPHYADAGQSSCVHHTFEHAKMLATCMDYGLFHGIDDELALAVELPRTTDRGVIHYPEIETWIITDENSTATLTGYDWEYLVGGHASGGTLSLYYHMKVGLLLCAGMGLYTLKERNNMQLPVSSTLHESLALRLEVVQNGDSYSSLYDDEAEIYWKGTCCTVKGVLKNKDHHSLSGQTVEYRMLYEFGSEKLVVSAFCPEAVLICSIISKEGEQVSTGVHTLSIVKQKGMVTFSTEGTYALPYGHKRIFNLIPGFQALRINMPPSEGKRTFSLTVD